MTLLRVDITGDQPAARDLAALDRALLSLPERAPVTLMLHGYRYAVGHRRNDPHDHILSTTGGSGRSLSWPRHLGFRDAGQGSTQGLAVAVGWSARGTIWAAYRASGQAARALATLLARIQTVSPGRRVGALGHSLGARVILQSLCDVAPGALSRAVLMSAAAFRCETRAALDTPSGRAAEFVNVTSRENDLFDLAFELLVAGGLRNAIGHGLGGDFTPSGAAWVDLQIDHPEVLRGLDRLGFALAPPARRVCHWSPYRRPGVFAIYRALLTDPSRMPLSALRTVAATQQPRWSRLLSRGGDTLPLSFGHGAPS